MSDLDLFYRFGAALVIGMLVGLQREHSHGGPDKEFFAGVRTFALFALIGCLAALAARELAAPLAFVGILGLLGVLILAAYLVSAQRGEIGLTTAASALVTALCGALCLWGYLVLAGALAVVTTGLLALKLEMHTFARSITHADIYAALKFAATTVIVLPLLPNQPLGPAPLDVVNPYKVWLMVVLISGISFLGYVLFKVAGAQRGIGLTGLLGGLVSSTAVTLSFARRSTSEPALVKAYALAIVVAWTVMFLRVGAIVAALNRQLLAAVWLPLLVAAGVGLAYSVYLYFAHQNNPESEISLANPFELRAAIVFGLLYMLILVGANIARAALGNAGVYLSSLAAGLADVDAITLSLAELSGRAGGIDPATGALAVMLAAMANTLVKGGLVLGTGSRELRRIMLPALLLMVIGGVGSALLVW